MSKFHVQIREVHVNHVEVEAETEEEAKDIAEKMLARGVDDLSLEYSHTLSKDHWTVEEDKSC
ncbi:MAG TPA: hypothetical protein VNA25_11770 [Phycisphaerae bacterium]|nr:hypothetical protein [Phycisphaerae bacterium]